MKKEVYLCATCNRGIYKSNYIKGRCTKCYCDEMDISFDDIIAYVPIDIVDEKPVDISIDIEDIEEPCTPRRTPNPVIDRLRLTIRQLKCELSKANSTIKKQETLIAKLSLPSDTSKKEDRIRYDIRRRERIAATGTSHTKEELLSLIERNGNRCYYCDRKFKTSKLLGEHRIPVYRGGSDDIANIVPSCWTCNTLKRGMTDEEYCSTAVYRHRKMHHSDDEDFL